MGASRCVQICLFENLTPRELQVLMTFMDMQGTYVLAMLVSPREAWCCTVILAPARSVHPAPCLCIIEVYSPTCSPDCHTIRIWGARRGSGPVARDGRRNAICFHTCAATSEQITLRVHLLGIYRTPNIPGKGACKAAMAASP